jgi:hypothetical protein
MRIRWLVLLPLMAVGAKHLMQQGRRNASRESASGTLDDALEDTFPASDPPSMTASTTAGL